VFRGENKDTPFQRILFDQNIASSKDVPLFFNVADINFDGYADVGILAEGGAMWGAYQYWIYDKTTDRFITARITDDFRKIHSGFGFVFNKDTKQVVVSGVGPVSMGYKYTYQFKNARLFPFERIDQETVVVDNEKTKTDEPVFQCKKTIRTYTGKSVKKNHRGGEK
jgi:hypothetical protein